MNILYLAHRVPFPPDKGDKLRSFHQLEHLATRHRLWCACFADDPADLRYAQRLREYCQEVAAIRLGRTPSALRGCIGLIRGGTVTESFFRCRAMRAVLRRWAEAVRFDVVVAFSSSMAPYALQVPAARRVLDLCDLDSKKWLDYAATSRGPTKWLYHAEGARLAAREVSWCNAFDATLVITEAEASGLRGRVDPARIHIVGNGVELPGLWDRLSPGAPGSRIGFVGVMDYRPNVDAVCWFVSACWPAIKAACPQAVFRIVGRSPTRRVRRLANANGVEVVGGVDDLGKELQRFDMSVAPMRIARGLQNKVLEAMAWAKPVVLTSKAPEGIAAPHDREFLIADQPTDIARGVVRLLRDQDARTRIGLSARQFVAAHHRWDDVLRRFELITTGAVEQTYDRAWLSPKTQAPPSPVPAPGCHGTASSA